MTTFGWVLIFTLVLLAVYLGWRWRRVEIERKKLIQRTLSARDEAHDLQNSNEQLTRALHAIEQVSANGIFLLDENKAIVWMNNSARELCIPDISLPLPLSQAVRSYEILTLVEDELDDDGPHERQFSSDETSYLAVAQRIFAEPALLALSVSDVTELLRLGRARRDFLANVSHDLRTPIAAIQLMVETLRSGAVDDNRRREQLLSGIFEQTASLQQLAQEMLDLSMIESGRMPLKMVETQIEDLIEPVYQRMITQAEHKEIELKSDYSTDIKAWADVNHVQRALQNLVHNAIKFTPLGGHVEIRAYTEGEDVVIEVADSGVGIAQEDIDHVFERFFKADRVRGGDGTGLGLAITRHIVLGHGGRIWVESEQGRGAAFRFTLLKV